MSEFWLDEMNVRKEFFLKLEKKYDKVGQDGGSYSFINW